MSASDLAAAMNAELFYELLVGEMSAAQGDMTNAVALLMEAARNSQSQQLYRRATEMALQSRSGQRALMAASEWQQNFPDSREANRYVLRILLMLNRVSESQAYLNREVQWVPAPAKPATYLAIAQLYSRASDKALAAAVVEQALQQDLAHPDLGPAAWATIGHLRLNAGQKELALQAVQNAHRLAPQHSAVSLLALELMEAGEPSAEALAQDYLNDDPAPTILLAYVRVLIGQQRWDDAQQQLDRLLQAQPDMPDAWMTQANLHAQRSQWGLAKAAIVKVEAVTQDMPSILERGQVLTPAYLLGARVAIQDKDYAQALTWLERIPNGEEALNVQSLKATALARQGKLAQGRAVLRAWPANGQNQEIQRRQAEVALLRDHGAPQEAYLLQRTLYDQHPNNPDIAYETAILAERAGKTAFMEQVLRQIIEQHPDHHHAYNALGYSLADRGERLPEAKTLIEKALSMAPDDPFITDSLAWVEFRMGNLKAALALLEKAYAQRNDAEIAAHLGEVLWANGDKARARSIWREALERDADNETLRSTLQRLKVQP